LTIGVLASAALIMLPVYAHLQGRRDGTQARMALGALLDLDGDGDGDDDPNGNFVRLATGQIVTPTAVDHAVQQFLNPGLPNYPDFVAGEAVRAQLSPDGTTLAIITAGENSLYKPDGTVDLANSTQYIFLYAVNGANHAKPSLVQVIQQANAHVGLVFAPDGNTLYAAGGSNDAVYIYTKNGTRFTPATPIALNHIVPGVTGLTLNRDTPDATSARNKGLGIRVQPNAGGLGISADGRTLVVANNYNDSITVIDTATRAIRYEHDLRPFFAGNEGKNGGIGGTFPFAVVVKGNSTAYVSSDRDREVVAIDISSPSHGKLITRIALDGNGLGMTLNKAQSTLYVAQDNADQVAVIDTTTNRVTAKIDARAPQSVLANKKYTGTSTSAVTLSPDGNTLYAINSGANSIAVIPLSGNNANTVTALIPTAYEPHDITFSADGSWMYIINGKSITGPNTAHRASNTANLTQLTYPGGNTKAAATARASNQYQFQLERASLVSAPVPQSNQLGDLTERVAQNNGYATVANARDASVMPFLHTHIKHIIYIVKENRTYDQMLGDLTNGANSDPNLTQFGQAITPNHHKLATQFVTLDNFMNPGDGSMDGWSWALQGRVTLTETLTQQMNYAAVNRGLSYESEGENRGVAVNHATVAKRDATAGVAGTTNYSTLTANLPGGTANLLTGTKNHASTDAPFGIEGGYIFKAVLKAGGTVRNYGFLVKNIGSIGTATAPVVDPFTSKVIQVAALDPALDSMTDVYYRGFDQNYPDLWRYNEWKREFDQFVANGTLPSLSLVRISHDHMGGFATALAGVNTPEAQQADCDLALGKMVEAVAKSRYAADTLFIITEDDVQDGPDHVDSHRGPAYLAGPYVKQGAVVSTRFNQVSVLRTIEDILGTEHINLNTASQRPMADAFDPQLSGTWTFAAEASTVLKETKLALVDGTSGVRFASGPVVRPQRDAAYWEAATAGFNFADADQVPPALFNRVLWTGLMGDKPYPAAQPTEH
jgi:YVTN family beta-propeller protein